MRRIYIFEKLKIIIIVEIYMIYHLNLISQSYVLVIPKMMVENMYFTKRDRDRLCESNFFNTSRVDVVTFTCSESQPGCVQTFLMPVPHVLRKCRLVLNFVWNTFPYNSYLTIFITTTFGISQDSYVALVCAKFRCDRIKLERQYFSWNLVEFFVIGTCAWCGHGTIISMA